MTHQLLYCFPCTLYTISEISFQQTKTHVHNNLPLCQPILVVQNLYIITIFQILTIEQGILDRLSLQRKNRDVKIYVQVILRKVLLFQELSAFFHLPLACHGLLLVNSGDCTLVMRLKLGRSIAAI